MRYLVLLLAVTVLAVYLGAYHTSAESAAGSRQLPACSSIPDKKAFITALYGRMVQDEVMPANGRLALATLHLGTPTFAFRPNEGAVLKFNILDFPGSVEAQRTAALLIGTGATLAEEYNLCLRGIEVVFYQDKRRLWRVITAVPPWGAEQISLVPLGRRGD